MEVAEAAFSLAGGLPPVTQSQNLPANLEGLPPLTPADDSYSHVLFHWMFITVTRRSLQLAVSTSCLTFATLQVCVPPPFSFPMYLCHQHPSLLFQQADWCLYLSPY